MSLLIRLFKGSKITDQDRVTKILDSETVFQQMGIEYSPDRKDNKKYILSSAAVIYRSVLMRCYVSKEELEAFDELVQIIEYNEDEIIKTIKYRVWHYNQLLREETENFINHSGRIMGAIKK